MATMTTMRNTMSIEKTWIGKKISCSDNDEDNLTVVLWVL